MTRAEQPGTAASSGGRAEAIESLVASFDESDPLRQRLREVLRQLPTDVIDDFYNDPRFSIVKMTRSLGGRNKGGDQSTMVLALPSATGQGSRCVVLKERLATCPRQFGLYVIAHELAHAFLRNGPWKQYTDIEEAADALAANWGFFRGN